MKNILPKYINNKDKWLLGEHIPDCDIFFFQIPASSFNNDSSYKFIKKFKKFLGIYNKFNLDFYVGDRDSFAVAESILKALVERSNFGNELNKNIIIWSYKLIEFSKKISKLPLKKYSNKQLWKLYNQNDKIHTKLYTYGWLPVGVDIFHNNFTNYLKRYLFSACDSKEQAEQAFVVFTTPHRKTIIAVEREEFIKIYKKYQNTLKKNQLSIELQNELVNHAKKWGHFGYIYAGNASVFDEKYYYNEFIDLLKNDFDEKKYLKKEDTRLKNVKIQQALLYKKLKINSLHKKLFSYAKNFALSKLVRRHAQLLNLHILHNTLISEIAKRLNLTRYQVQFMLAGEVKRALSGGNINKTTLVTRLKHCVFYAEKNFEKIYTGTLASKLIKNIDKKIDKNITSFTGQIARPGLAKGVVKIIIRASDMGKMNKGDILVSIATDPDIVPAMKKAAGIITEQGGITSHAAIVSRELGIPCIIGTKIATKVLKDGDWVEMNANQGLVRKI